MAICLKGFRMIRFLLPLLVALSIGSAGRVAAASEPSCPAWELQVPVLSQYVLESTGVVINREPVFQPNVTASCATPYGMPYLNLWTSVQLGDGWFSERTLGSEIDLTAGWLFNFGRDKRGYGDFSVAYFDVYPVMKNGRLREDTVQLNGEVGWEFTLSALHSLAPYGRLEVPFPTNDDLPVGAYYWAGLRYTWKVHPQVKLRQRGWLVYADNAYGAESGFVAGWRLDLDLAAASWLTVTPNVRVMHPISSFEDDRETQLIGGVNLSVRF